MTATLKPGEILRVLAKDSLYDQTTKRFLAAGTLLLFVDPPRQRPNEPDFYAKLRHEFWNMTDCHRVIMLSQESHILKYSETVCESPEV